MDEAPTADELAAVRDGFPDWSVYFGLDGIFYATGECACGGSGVPHTRTLHAPTVEGLRAELVAQERLRAKAAMSPDGDIAP